MRRALLAFFRVSERPAPPPGSGAEPAIFRASKRYLYYTVLTWIPKQVAAFFGLLFSLAFFGSFDRELVRAEGWERFMGLLGQLEVSIGRWSVAPTDFFGFFEALAVAVWAGQLLFTAIFLKLSWELRWYIVGESSLRIREGLWFLREQTMTVANIQNMKVRQGPLQRLLGIADLEVRTAGGAGGQGSEEDPSGDSRSSFHVGRFRGLDDARALRDRIRALLVEHRGAGLGDADDSEGPAEAESDSAAEEVRDAARSLLEEARALR